MGTLTCTFAPPGNEEFLTVQFDLIPGTQSGLNIQDILLVIDDQQEFHPEGHGSSVGIIYGNFTKKAETALIQSSQTGIDQVMLTVPALGDGSGYSKANLWVDCDVATTSSMEPILCG